MRIVGYCDFDGNSIIEQIEVSNKLNIKHLLIRRIDEKTILELTDEDIKNINLELRNAKKDIYSIDPLIKSHDLYDINGFDKNVASYEKAFIIANKLRVTNVNFRLQLITNILDEFETLQKQLNVYLELSKKYKVLLNIVQQKEKSNELVYILKKYKKREFTLVFNPKQTILNGESPVVAYRLLKDYFDILVAGDIDKINNPELLGYGRVKIIDLFKRMNRDEYKGYFILDDEFSKFIENEETKKVPWYKKPFVRKKNIDNYLKAYSLRIFPDQEIQDVTIFDIYENQISVLKIAFRLRG